MKVAGYEIIREEEFAPGYFVALGVHPDGRAVTWESTGPDNYFWGHYFQHLENAVVDYHERIASLLKLRLDISGRS